MELLPYTDIRETIAKSVDKDGRVDMRPGGVVSDLYHLAKTRLAHLPETLSSRRELIDLERDLALAELDFKSYLKTYGEMKPFDVEIEKRRINLDAKRQEVALMRSALGITSAVEPVCSSNTASTNHPPKGFDRVTVDVNEHAVGAMQEALTSAKANGQYNQNCAVGTRLMREILLALGAWSCDEEIRNYGIEVKRPEQKKAPATLEQRVAAIEGFLEERLIQAVLCSGPRFRAAGSPQATAGRAEADRGASERSV